MQQNVIVRVNNTRRMSAPTGAPVAIVNVTISNNCDVTIQCSATFSNGIIQASDAQTMTSMRKTQYGQTIMPTSIHYSQNSFGTEPVTIGPHSEKTGDFVFRFEGGVALQGDFVVNVSTQENGGEENAFQNFIIIR